MTNPKLTTDQLPIDTDNTLSADSDLLIPTQKAVKRYVDDNAGGGGGSGGHTIEDEGTPLTDRAKLNFVGAGVIASDDDPDNATVVTVAGFAADVNAATEKTTPVDADRWGIWDSVSGLIRHVTWANIKATLKTYFDTLYATLVHTHAASDVTSGTIDTARLGSGTADNTTFLRGDQTWATPSSSGSVPAGGTTGQVLTKQSDTDYDTIWATVAAGVFFTELSPYLATDVLTIVLTESAKAV